MHEKQKAFKRPPRKHTPKGLEILYEDRDIVVVEKTDGLLTVGTEKIKENTAHFLVNEYVRKGNPKSRNRAYIVHRLDKETSGILVFAKSEEVKEFLQKNWPGTQKKYVAVLSGTLKEKEGLVTSFLLENSVHRMYSVQKSETGKRSKTAYRVLKESEHFSLVEIDLLTGRKHQIRVHMADKGCPVAGDKKYGVKGQGVKRLCLHAASLTLVHPFTKESMTFESEIPPYFHNVMCKKLEPAEDVKTVDPAPRVSAPSATANKTAGGKKPRKTNAQRKAAALKRAKKDQRRK
ncbi:Ribosomal large subunit pseudouridine synthase C [Pontiella desulfatans]|uniref:Ribosomal large subunit pseudouridine synthase C n=1 Tax=Pontiella desulfatans TaxID=2750659 RepID=A0A6C2U326_PONDE|nr:RluA family pseudouridine synthase [Pontiella desulfatans]VGO14408.1 Ribosomal large subunit pseudouridine synthase C [Pontiella desulfatans]